MNTRSKRILLGLALFVVIWLPFSSTFLALRSVGGSLHESFIYKGISTDFEVLTSGGEYAMAAKVRCLIDLPVSAIADTVCLPYTVYRTATQPRKIAVRFLRKEDGGPGVDLQSDLVSEERHLAPLTDVCSVLTAISGKLGSVKVVVDANNSVSTEDFGRLYETMAANKTLKWFYLRKDTETNLLTAYLASKASKQPVQPPSASRSGQDDPRTPSLAASRTTVFALNESSEWTREIPASRGLFLGKQLMAVIDRRSVADGQPRDKDLVLLDEILSDLPSILITAQEALAKYEQDPKGEYIAHVYNPQIWIHEDQEHPKEWTFVVERDDWPDFGWHIEFKGMELVELWAGD